MYGPRPAARAATQAIRIALQAAVIVTAGAASAQQAPPGSGGPPSAITPPPGNKLLLSATGTGSQDYTCLPTDGGQTAWTFERPQALLTIPLAGAPLQAAEHFLGSVPGQVLAARPGCTLSGAGPEQYCPAWRASLDQSTVWASKIATETAGTGPDCPNHGAIACLLLKPVAISNGLFPKGLLSDTTYVVRAYTQGGSPPTTACTTGEIAQIPYTAQYDFYSAP
jgi:hypothetical protein